MAAERLGLFGIRHHGPGSARSLLAALADLDPAIVLIEGPADASGLLHYAALPDMVPPLALLVHAEAEPANAVFYPFAAYSPEWQAIRWALTYGRTVRFIDLPGENKLALQAAIIAEAKGDGLPEETEWPVEPDLAGEAGADTATANDPAEAIRRDPLGYLAAVAGYDDGEAWWNALIEQSANEPAVFAAIESAMSELRSHTDSSGPRMSAAGGTDDQREAHMRLAIAAAVKQTDGPVAVVCGAWHVPALRQKRKPADDRALIKGMPRIKVAATWIPWTDTRLAAASGYGAGVASPGWYAHLWNEFGADGHSGRFTIRGFTARWQVRVASLLRDKGRPASTASVIDAARLAEALAGIRDLAMPGLEEMRAASLSALCFGEPAPMALIESELVIGRGVGRIDEGVPQMPLAGDLARWQKRLKLKPEALDREISLDLRSESGLAKSLLLHRLTMIKVPWGTLTDTRSSRGTFRENWILRWEPEFSVALAEALVYGTTIEQAAGNAAIEEARAAGSLAGISDIVRGCLLAGLDEAARQTIALLQERAVATSDVAALAGAVPPLATILRYGTARAMPIEELRLLVVSLAEAVCAGLVHACRRLQPPEAESLRQALVGLDQALTLLDRAATTDAWQRSLAALADDGEGDQLLRGFAVRALYDRAALDAKATGGYLSRGLSRSVPPAEAGRWLEGFLGQAGQVLLHDAELRGVVGDWLAGLDEDIFMSTLPMLRRAFTSLDASERRRLLDEVVKEPVVRRESDGSTTHSADAGALAPGFVAALPLLLTILGLDREKPS